MHRRIPSHLNRTPFPCCLQLRALVRRVTSHGEGDGRNGLSNSSMAPQHLVSSLLCSSTSFRAFSSSNDNNSGDAAGDGGILQQAGSSSHSPPSAVVDTSYDRFGGEKSFEAPAEGEELDLVGGAGTRVPWPEVQRQLQLFISNAVMDPKSSSKGRTFLRDFDVLSNLTSISDGLELLYYMERLAYPPNSKLEVSLVSWLLDNTPLITTTHVVDICRFAVEQKSFEFWKRCILLTDAFIPHLMELLSRSRPPPPPPVASEASKNNSKGSGGKARKSSRVKSSPQAPEASAVDGGGELLAIEDYVLVSRVLQHSREEMESAYRKSLMPGVEYAKKRPIFKIIVQRVAEELRNIDGDFVEESLVTPELVGNIVKHVATLDPACHAQTNLIDSLEVIFAGATAVDAMRYLTAMSDSGADFPSLLEVIVDRVEQHAKKDIKPAPSSKGKRTVTKKATIRAIRDDPEKHEESESIVDVTYITRALLLVTKIVRGSDLSIAGRLLETLRPAVETIQKMLTDRQSLVGHPDRIIRLLSDLGGIAEIVELNILAEDDPLVVSMRDFVRVYIRNIDEAVQQGSAVDTQTLEECGYCLNIASRLMDTELAGEISNKAEEICTIVANNVAKPKAGSVDASITLSGALRVIEGLAAIGSFPPRIVDMCVRVCLAHRTELSSKDVSAIIFVAGICKSAQFDSEVFHQLTGRLLNTAKFRKNDVLGPNAVAQLLRGLAAAGIKPDERLQAFLSEQALKYTSDFSVRDSTSLLIVVHQLGLDKSTVGQRLGLEVAASIPRMNADDLVRLASVLAELNLRDVCMLDAIGFRLRDRFTEIKPKHLTEFAMSLRELNFSSMFSKCGLSDLVPAVKGLTANDATFLMSFCPAPIQEVIISKYINTKAVLEQLSPASLITVYGVAPDHMSGIRDRSLELLAQKECPQTVSADIGCLAVCRAINSADPARAMTEVVTFIAPIAKKFTSSQIEVIIDQLRRVIAEAVPEEQRVENEERDLQYDKEDKLAELGKEGIVGRTHQRGHSLVESAKIHTLSASLRGSAFKVPPAFYRFIGRRLCANVDFLSAETSLAALDIYMHGRVRDDKVVKALFTRLRRTHRPIVNSPRLTRIALSLIEFYSVAWSGGLGSILKAKAAVRTRTFQRSSLEP